jgi:hypothetical protein
MSSDREKEGRNRSFSAGSLRFWPLTSSGSADSWGRTNRALTSAFGPIGWS